ncbi:MAG: glycosyltransferase, partial [Clostridia bacterium]|nr:glycosyltransferase [Clostridia bacterium]
MKISVALAAYKGEKYIAEQLRSILAQIGDDSEIIVSDDRPCESMRTIVEGFDDSRIKYVEGPGQGVIKNFEYALSLCEGDYIFLCDQDDVWREDKVEKCLRELENGYLLVLHNAEIVDAELNDTGKTFFESHGVSVSVLKNLLVNSFVGCCMAFKKELKDHILPFPEKIPMHDQ